MKKILLALLLLYTAHSFAYECDGRTRCSQMSSCDEARWFIQNCPNSKMDGDHDGKPCERQCDDSENQVGYTQAQDSAQQVTAPLVKSLSIDNAGSITDGLHHVFRNKQSGVQVLGIGVVEKLLPDDNNGTHHQRFIVRSNSGISVLIAHNIDLAPRVPALVVGEKITFYGVYEWNDHGGVVHWTHRDPQGQHLTGWVSYGGKKYQ